MIELSGSSKPAIRKSSKSSKGKQKAESESEEEDIRDKEIRRLRKKGSYYLDLADEMERGRA